MRLTRIPCFSAKRRFLVIKQRCVLLNEMKGTCLRKTTHGKLQVGITCSCGAG